jgi:UDP-glucose 4-epimerase
MERLAAGQPPLILGDGSQTMDFVFTTDIARANLMAAQADITDDVFNVASGVETSLRDLAEALAAVMDASHLGLEYGPARRVNPVARRLADTSAAASRLGFKAQVGLEDGLRQLVAWWRAARPEFDA